MAGPVTVLSEEWVTLEEAMQRLGKFARSVQRLANAGHIRWQLTAGTRTRVYHAGDVERVREEDIPAGRDEPRYRLAWRPDVAPTAPLSPNTTQLAEQWTERLTAPRCSAVSERLAVL